MFARVALAFVDVAHGRLVQRKASLVSWKAATLFREVVVPQLAGGFRRLVAQEAFQGPRSGACEKNAHVQPCRRQAAPAPQGSVLSFEFVGGL